MTTPLTSSQKQSRRIAELNAIAQAAGWQTWTQYATAVKRGVVSIAANPAASRANPLTRAGGKHGGRPKKEIPMKKSIPDPLPLNLKNDVAYLEVAAKSAPTARERAWAKRQLKRIDKKS